MGAHVSTNIQARGHSTLARPIKWSSFDSGANNIAINVSGAADASKLLVLVACHSTLVNRFWIGTSDSRSSHTSMSYPFLVGDVRRFLVKTTVEAAGSNVNIFKSTVSTAAGATDSCDTEVRGIYVLGPFETARFRDSDGYINICRGITTAGGASHSTDAQYIAAIQIP